ncbi:hypothetical protein LTR37_020100 [Vermiconidia calcicola]|uniref:Uncharacterized protein n=1 Tax=Vermiconidia calcicola TaxID=1690605 RepID=A0ACC3MC90_9PEZI|nr:hypothetical protein LTR37_020100 [Vermiconidia calcicola]
MAHSPTDADSRYTAVGRKKLFSYVSKIDARFASLEKRMKPYLDMTEKELDEISRESGEISTDAESSRPISRDSNEASFDLGGQRYRPRANKWSGGISTDAESSRSISRDPTAYYSDLAGSSQAKAASLSMAEVKRLLDNPAKFSRRMSQSDLGPNAGFNATAEVLHEEWRWSWEQCVLNLLTDHDYHDRARRTINRYIDNCRINYDMSEYDKQRMDAADDEDGEQSMDVSDDEDGEQSMEMSDDEDSDGGVALDGEAATGSYDYGEMARAAASGAGTHSLSGGSRGDQLSLKDLSDHEQLLQCKYYNVYHHEHQQQRQCRDFITDDPDAVIRCLSCGKQGHMEDDCPELTCTHCGAFDEHFSGACPRHIKCGRCRQRGHDAADCENLRRVEAGGPGDPCDVCGGGGHAEEECSGLWRTYVPSESNIKKISREQNYQLSMLND